MAPEFHPSSFIPFPLNPNRTDNSAAGENLADRFLVTRQELEVDKLFRALVKLEGSDLHLKVGRPRPVCPRQQHITADG